MQPVPAPQAKKYAVEKLHVAVYSDRDGMGNAAAAEAAGWLTQTIEAKAKARVIFACAPSQSGFDRLPRFDLAAASKCESLY